MTNPTISEPRIKNLIKEVERLAGVERDQIENGNLIYDKVLASINSEVTRQEAIITDFTENSVQLKFKGSHNWYSPSVIVDNLGQASNNELMAFTIEPPAAINTVKYQTGTYILDSELGTLLVEVDRVADIYFIRLVGTAVTIPLTNNHISRLFQFSDPDNGDYVTEPGIYMVISLFLTIEVIPYNGVSYFRWLDSPELYRLTSEKIKEIARVESDSLDINAVMIVDKSELEEKTKPCAEEKCCIQEPCAEPEFVDEQF